MVKIMENPIKIDDLGGFPIIFGLTPIWFLSGPDLGDKIGPRIFASIDVGNLLKMRSFPAIAMWSLRLAVQS